MIRKKSDPNQFQLFASGKELRDGINHSFDAREGEHLGDMWDRKVGESVMPSHSGVHGAGVYASLDRHGYQGEPLTVEHYTSGNQFGKLITEGHHRVASAAHIEETQGRPLWIPLEHKEYE